MCGPAFAVATFWFSECWMTGSVRGEWGIFVVSVGVDVLSRSTIGDCDGMWFSWVWESEGGVEWMVDSTVKHSIPQRTGLDDVSMMGESR